MSRRAFHSLASKTHASSSPSYAQHRPLPSTSRPFTSALAHPPVIPDATSELSPKDRLVSMKTKELMDSLARDGSNHSRPWGFYVDLQNFVGLDMLPLELHQLVLRGCVPPPLVLRTVNAQRFRARYFPDEPHPYESRLQTVIRNIRSAGWIPALEDYHVVLEQFAAVGHYVGADKILKEIQHVGLEPSPKTYGLCLQAMAHRLKLPSAEEFQPRLLSGITKLCRSIMAEMAEKGLPLTSANVDLAIRILRETADDKTFDQLIKLSYGVDLSYPDRLPLELTGERSPAVAGEEDLTERLTSLQPLSTSALNTIIDMLGRSGRISNMVSAFEVLTQPLPTTRTSSSSFDEDDEDDAFYPPVDNSSSSSPLPNADANTKTFHLLLKYVSRASNATLARHYVNHALEYDRRVDRRLRGDVMRLSPGDIISPSFAVNRGTLLPVFGEANRDKNVALMRFVLRATRRSIRRKTADIKFYTEWKDAEFGDIAAREGGRAVERDLGATGSLSDSTGGPDSSASTPSTSTPFRSSNDLLAATQEVFDVDLDGPPVAPARPPKIFNVGLHLTLLERDIGELRELEARADHVLGRSLQRVKERLGRRVWTAKDLYLASEKRRVRIARPTWREIVQFRVLDKGSLPRFMGKNVGSFRQ
ncbi:hypothetical protein FA95DRAFT_834861 [Auriscalpium vulgare]|uniref:Uncharacterized protein n=1 Tax=Auriscalpium vulgare TaxID=40419 RepID=A0ACB8RZW1_9AGAM|nr:hypothetical protein FA95DRAFT_834861 [Auriscalpium vulgare]